MPANQNSINEPSIQSQENFPQVLPNNNELYEFLPEEIFQLDHPIVPKSETQNYDQQIHNSNYTNEVSSPSFIDLSSSQQTTKFPSTSSTHIDTEINNNMNYQLDDSNTISTLKSQQHNDVGYVNNSSKFYCNENEKISRKRNYDVESSKHVNNGQVMHHNGYHSNLMYSKKGDNNASCFVQLYNHANNRYSSEMYGRSSEAYRSAEKFNNFITN